MNIMHESYLMENYFRPSQDNIYTILVCTKAKKMNPTYEIVRQYFSQYPVPKSVENYMYQCLVNFIFVFVFVPSFVFSYTDSQIL